ncbi:HAD family hydrolase, partial [uncultured Dubosiella sp.]
MHYDDAPVLLPATRQTKVTYWCDYGLDVIPKDGGKDQGLLRVAHHFGAEPSETIAFGDGLNDLDMLRTAGIGVAMGNAMEGLKKAADYVTRTVEEEGVAFALRHFHLI